MTGRLFTRLIVATNIYRLGSKDSAQLEAAPARRPPPLLTPFIVLNRSHVESSIDSCTADIVNSTWNADNN